MKQIVEGCVTFLTNTIFPVACVKPEDYQYSAQCNGTTY